MKTLTATYKELVKRLKNDLDFTNCESEPDMIITILEPSCNMDFTATITKITKDGKIYSKQFEDSPEEDWFKNEFSHLIDKHSKQNVINLLLDNKKSMKNEDKLRIIVRLINRNGSSIETYFIYVKTYKEVESELEEVFEATELRKYSIELCCDEKNLTEKQQKLLNKLAKNYTLTNY